MARVITVTLNPCLDKTIGLNGLKIGEVNRAEEVLLNAGGKGINVSRALKKFGTDNTALGIIGGAGGEQLQKILSAEGVKTAFLKVEGETRTNCKIVDAQNRSTTDINEPGIYIEDLTEFIKLYTGELKGADYAVLSGSIPPGVDCEIYRKLTEIAKAAGVRVILDASGAPLKEGVKAKPYAIKPNLAEFEELLARPMRSTAEVLSGIREVIDSGVELVVVSLGGDGAIFATKDAAYKAGVLDIEVKSTVGCGDAVVSGIVYSLAEGLGLEKMAAFAATAGGITATKAGTEMCGLAEVEGNLAEIKVERISENRD